MSFDDLLTKAADFFLDNDSLLLVAHADADGICATAILEEVLSTRQISFRSLFLAQVSAIALKRIAAESTGAVVFVDMGSSHLSVISEAFAQRPILVLDHHRCEGTVSDLLLINPFLADLNGTRDISASGIAAEIACRIDESFVRLIPLALIGAQADNQEPFEGYNNALLGKAVSLGLVRMRQGARLYGIERRPLVKLVANSYDLKIPGVTGSLPGARDFLQRLNIPLRVGGGDAFFRDLSIEERQRMEDALIAASPNPDASILHYGLLSLPKGPLRDTREAATVVNACGRLGMPERGVAMLRGEPSAIEEVEDMLGRYGSLVHDAHRWVSEAIHRRDPAVMCHDHLIIINAGNRFPAEIAGTLCSVLVRGGEVSDDMVVVCLVHSDAGTIKVSSRTRRTALDLAVWIRAAAEMVGGEGGGHAVAAGAVIPLTAERAFIDAILNSFQ